MYYRLTTTLNSVGKFIPENAQIEKYIKDNNVDHYLSIYKYNDEQKNLATRKIPQVNETTGEEYERNRGVSGIKDVTTNLLVFDFDSEKNLEEAEQDTMTLLERLWDYGIHDVNISFSGNKGFSVVVNHDKELTPKQHKDIAKALAGDLKTWDTKVYNASRVFRLDNTKHNISGLYKTPLTLEQLQELDIDEIKELAKKGNKNITFKKTTLPDKLLKLKPKKVEKEPESNLPTDVQFKLDFSKKPFYLTDVKYALHKGFIPPTHGNEGMMILCSTYKHVGFDKKDAYHILKGVNEKRAEIYNIEKRSNDDIWNQVVEVVYANNWNGGTYNEKENQLLVETAKTFGISDHSKLESFSSMMDNFFDFASNINKNVIKTGIKSLDESVLITTGMMVGVLGAPSAGKTSLVTSIIEKSAKEGMKPIFHSLDMHKHLMSMRLIQRQTGKSVETKLRQSIKGDPTYNPDYDMAEDNEIRKAVNELSKIYSNVQFNFTRGATIESIEEDIKMNKVRYGDKFKLVVVDYLEKVRGPYSDATANSGYVASRLSDLASTYDVAIILLLQPQKSAGDPSEELLSMRKVKGASVIEQDCRVILTMWRPGFNPRSSDTDKFASIAIVKNNMGEVKTLDYNWNGLKGEFDELKQYEREELENLRAAIAQARQEENSRWDI